MALPANSVWEVRPTTGSDPNGGGFVTGSSGTDYSQQAAPQYALTGLTAAGAGATLATVSASADMVGNIANSVSGTNVVTGPFQIVSVVVGVSITFDRNITTGATVNAALNIGGAKQTIGAINTIWTTGNTNVTGQTAWCRAESGISAAAQISMSPNGGASFDHMTQFNGYTTTRGDGGQVTVTASTGGFTMLFMQPGCPCFFRNFIFDGNHKTTMTGASLLGTFTIVENLTIKNCDQGGITFNNQHNIAVNVLVTGCSGNPAFLMESGNGPNYAIDCQAIANASVGFQGNSWVGIRCLSANNTGANGDGFRFGANIGGIFLDSCLAYANGRDGYRWVDPETWIVCRNCIGYGNAGFQFNSAGAALVFGSLTFDYNFYGGGGAGNLNGLTAGPHDHTLSADPTTAGVSNNFALNNTAGGGAVVRGNAFPGTLQLGGTGSAAGGPLQPSAGGGGGGGLLVNPGMQGGMRG